MSTLHKAPRYEGLGVLPFIAKGAGGLPRGALGVVVRLGYASTMAVVRTGAGSRSRASM